MINTFELLYRSFMLLTFGQTSFWILKISLSIRAKAAAKFHKAYSVIWHVVFSQFDTPSSLLSSMPCKSIGIKSSAGNQASLNHRLYPYPHPHAAVLSRCAYLQLYIPITSYSIICLPRFCESKVSGCSRPVHSTSLSNRGCIPHR